MKGTIAEKILSTHLIHGKIEKKQNIGIKIDQTLTQDATGTMAYLQFEQMGIPKVRTDLSVSYVDHNTLQTDFRNADDHRYLQSVAAKYGLYFSKPGNGICHQLHLERFSVPGKTLLGSDSHTPTCGGIGMLAIGAGGLDVAVAMAGEPFFLTVPEIVNINLTGELPPFVSAKDLILEVLNRLNVKGGINKILEYSGSGVKTLSVPERATITNMGTETGATSSIFPSDEITLDFLTRQNREKDWRALKPNEDAVYDEILEINMTDIEPLAATPHSPGNIKRIADLERMEINQVCIGSCTNSSLRDLKTVAQILKGNVVHKDVSLTISPGSRQVVNHLIESDEVSYIIESGARILENACGPCIGMGQAPGTNAISLRTFNRNFLGRSGTKDAQIYLVSPETAAVSAIEGKITDPRNFKTNFKIEIPGRFLINDSLIIPPLKNLENVDIYRGPNIKPLPSFPPLEERLKAKVLLKVGDNITTDHIIPAGAKILPLRSNIPALSNYVFSVIDENFYERALDSNGGFVVGGENYGQGSSREHAAIAPKYLGIKAIIAKSFARIHKDNLVNFGILPLVFQNNSDYDQIRQEDRLELVLRNIDNAQITAINLKNHKKILLTHNLSMRDLSILKIGGKLPYIRQKNA
ncbi:MAG: aconitate hydratase [Candidatus Lokiarchaeota archaeon]|nr:aconitate hydratase [Candidatus Lokiarchaeota archaeon]MBD3202532.1 aconitate hydratase [Candidatus Lokiarchaeota archaeon]